MSDTYERRCLLEIVKLVSVERVKTKKKFRSALLIFDSRVDSYVELLSNGGTDASTN